MSYAIDPMTGMFMKRGPRGATGAAGTNGVDGADGSPLFNNRKSLLLNGTTQYVDFGQDIAYERTDAFSFVAWVYLSNATNDQTIFSKRTDTTTAGIQLRTSAARPELFLVNTQGANMIRAQAQSQNILGAQWNCIIVTYDGSSLAAGVKFYINGGLGATVGTTDNLSASIASAENFRLGALGGGTSFLGGAFDEVGFYDRALTQSEAQEIYRSFGTKSLQLLSSGTSLVQYYRCGDHDDDVAPVFFDSVGGINGTIVNGATYQNDVPLAMSRAIEVFNDIHPAIGGEMIENWAGGTGLGSLGWTQTLNSGINTTTAAIGAPGLLVIQTSTSATAAPTIFLGNISYQPGSTLLIWEARVGVHSLSTAAEEYKARAGIYFISSSSSPANGIYFEYDRTVSTFWQCKTRASSVETSTTTTALAPVTTSGVPGLFQNLRIEINTPGTEVKFYINSILVATHTTNIPTVAIGLAEFQMIKTVGTTSRFMYCDWFAAKWVIN